MSGETHGHPQAADRTSSFGVEVSMHQILFWGTLYLITEINSVKYCKSS